MPARLTLLPRPVLPRPTAAADARRLRPGRPPTPPLRGLRAVLPFFLGVAFGEGLLALSLHLALGTVADVPGGGWAGRAAGAALLLFVALRTLRPAGPSGAAPGA